MNRLGACTMPIDDRWRCLASQYLGCWRRLQMAEPTWNGFLRLSLVSCRVYLSPATTDTRRVKLEPLNPGTGNPVAEQFVDTRTGDVVPREAAVPAYKAQDGQFIRIDDDELTELAGPPTEKLTNHP